jgi:uncharacterized membrane protein YccF (DUF307 family)
MRELAFLANVVWWGSRAGGLPFSTCVAAVILAVFIGLPFAWAHSQARETALWPIGKIVVLGAERRTGRGQAFPTPLP